MKTFSLADHIACTMKGKIPPWTQCGPTINVEVDDPDVDPDDCEAFAAKVMIAEDDPDCTPICVTLAIDGDGETVVLDPRYPGEKRMLTGYSPAPIDTSAEVRFQGEVNGFCEPGDGPYATAGDLAADVDLPLLTAKGCLAAIPASIEDFCAAAYGKVPCGQRYCPDSEEEPIVVGGTPETDFVFVGGLETFGAALGDSSFAGFNKDATIKKGETAVMPYCLQAEKILSGADLKALKAAEITVGVGGVLSAPANLCAGEEIETDDPAAPTTTVTDVQYDANTQVMTVQTSLQLAPATAIKKKTLLRTAGGEKVGGEG